MPPYSHRPIRHDGHGQDRQLPGTADGWIKAEQNYGGGLVWRRVSTGEETASIGYYVSMLDGPPTIRLQHTTKRRGDDQRESMDYTVGLTTTPLPWGGVRWWFVCPLMIDGWWPCRRRVGKLYLPLGGRRFGCRHCYDLTYESCQDSHKYDHLYGLLAADTGMSAAAIKRILNRKDRSKRDQRRDMLMYRLCGLAFPAQDHRAEAEQ